MQPQRYTGQPWQNQREQRLPIVGNHPFYLMHNPLSWELVYMPTADGETYPAWVPKLRRLWNKPGVNGCREGGDSAPAELRFMKEGNVLLDPAKLDYIRQYPARKGWYFQEKWYTVEILAGRMIERFDHATYNAWRLSLVRDHHVAPPHEHVLTLQIDIQRQRIERLIRDQHIPEKKAALKNEQSILADMLQAAEDTKEYEH